jgi:hypothetical protein
MQQNVLMLFLSFGKPATTKAGANNSRKEKLYTTYSPASRCISLQLRNCGEHSDEMAEIAEEQPLVTTKRSLLQIVVTKLVVMFVLGLLLGFGYDLASAKLYGPERVPGFRLGVVHGGLMPAALPALLLGRDVPIYAGKNEGRIYKVGYICGINLCGLIFFGAAFRKPKQKVT